MEFHRLDTRVPPLWESFWDRVNPNADDPHIDEETSLQHTVGDDIIHYRTRQRIEGDLFRRDLILEKNLLALYGLLRKRSGLNFNTPEVRLLPGSSIVLAQFNSTHALNGWLGVGVGASITSGIADDITVSIRNVTDDVDVMHATGNEVVMAAAEVVDPLDQSKTYSCVMTNTGTGTVIASGFAVLQPSA